METTMDKLNKTLDEKMAQGREYRMTQVIETRDAEDAQEETYEVRGYACTFNEPYVIGKMDNYTVREQIAPEAFNDCDMSDVIMQYDHVGRVFARTGNNTLELSIDDHGLHMDRAYLGGTEIGRQLNEEIRGGYTTKMSFGFTVSKDERTVTEDHDTGEVDVLRTVTGISKLWDVSAVSLPANNATEISARGYCDGAIAEAKEEVRKAHEAAETERRKKQLRLQLELEDLVK